MPDNAVTLKISALGGNKAAASVDKVTASLKKLRDEALATRDAMAQLGDTTAATTDKNVAASREQAAAAKTSAAATEKATLAADAGTAASMRRSKTLTQEAAATRNAENASKGFGTSLSNLANSSAIKKLSLFGGLGLGGLLYEGFKQYSSITTQMTQVSSQAGLAMSRIPGLTKGGWQIAKETGVGMQGIAQSMYMIASGASGLHYTNNELERLAKVSAQLDVLGNITDTASQENTARLMMAMMNAHIRGAQTPNQIGALINATVGTGDIRMNQLLTLIGRGIIPSTLLTKESAPSVMAWIDLLTKTGNNPSSIGTLVSHANIMLQGVTGQASKVMDMLGLSSGQMATIQQTQGPFGAISAFANSVMHGTFHPTSSFPQTGGRGYGAQSAAYQFLQWGIQAPGLSSQQTLAQWQAGTLSQTARAQILNQMLAKAYGGARQSLPVETMVALGNMYPKIYSEILKQSNTKQFQKDYQQMLNSPQWQMARAKVGVQNVMYDIGKDFKPYIVQGAHYLANIAGWLDKHGGVLKMLGVGAASLVAVATGIVAWEKLIKPMGSFISPLMKWLGFGSGGSSPQRVAMMNLEAARMQLSAAEANAGGRGIGAAEGGLMSGATTASSRFARVGSMLSSGVGLALGAALRGGMAYAITQALPKSVLKNSFGQLGQYALIGGAAGSQFGPEGAIIGAVAGALLKVFQQTINKVDHPNTYGDLLPNGQYVGRGLTTKNAWTLHRAGHDIWSVHRFLSNKYLNPVLKDIMGAPGALFHGANSLVRGAGNDLYNVGHSVWDDIFGGGSHKKHQPPNTKVPKGYQQLADAANKLSTTVDHLTSRGIPVTITTSAISKASNKGNQIHSSSNIGKFTVA